MDSANFVALLLLDKGYFDYDFEKVEKKVVYVPKSDEELKDIMAGFGIGTAVGAPKTLEEIQSHIIEQLED